MSSIMVMIVGICVTRGKVHEENGVGIDVIDVAVLFFGDDDMIPFKERVSFMGWEKEFILLV